MKKVAIITGATGGIGAGFVKELVNMDDVDEVWAIGRNKLRLEELKKISPKVVIIEADLSVDGVDIIDKKIKEMNKKIDFLKEKEDGRIFHERAANKIKQKIHDIICNRYFYGC